MTGPEELYGRWQTLQLLGPVFELTKRAAPRADFDHTRYDLAQLVLRAVDHLVVQEASLEIGLITGTWTRSEVSGALVRAARAGRGDEAGLLELLDGDLGTDGPVTVVAADQNEC